MEESQGTSTGGDYNQTAKIISYGDSAKNYIARLARKVKEIAGTAKEKSLPEALRIEISGTGFKPVPTGEELQGEGGPCYPLCLRAK